MEKISFIGNLRVLLTILVIIQHLIVGYGGGSGRWYYNDPGMTEGFSWYAMTYVWLINQSFFMGFLFMLSSYFTRGSYDRKGAAIYLRSRLRRLGVPLAIYIVIVNPILSYAAWIQKAGFEGSFLEFIGQYFAFYHSLDVGVLWFVEVLLIFSLIYATWRFIGSVKPIKSLKFRLSANIPEAPSNVHIAGFSFILGGFVFVDRLFFPSNQFLERLGLPGGHICQYFVLLVIGLIAYRKNWFSTLTKDQGIFWISMAVGLMLLLPVTLNAAGIYHGHFSPYSLWDEWNDGRSLLIFSIWEQFTCVALVIGLLILFREKLNYQNHFIKTMDSSTFSVYLVHAPIITILIFAFRNLSLDPAIKCILVSPIAVVLCFLVGQVARKLPIAKSIL